ncbi:hypothetical protein M3Y99_00921000 [Aphelenchoides fujianensis]|nr:hypothetical protein M3Y99_00921000 [Aphelenchoides fujianensis]
MNCCPPDCGVQASDVKEKPAECPFFCLLVDEPQKECEFECFLWATVTMVIAGIALLINGYALFKFHRLQSMKNSHGRLSVVRSAADLILLVILGVWCGGLSVFAERKAEWTANANVMLMAVFHYAHFTSINGQFVIVIERHVAICYPFAFARIFRRRLTLAYVLGIVVVSLSEATLIPLLTDCVLTFHPADLNIAAECRVADEWECRRANAHLWLLEGVFSGTPLVLAVSFDVLSFVSLRERNNNHLAESRPTERQRDFRRAREHSLFVQSLLGTLVIVLQLALFGFTLLSNFGPTRNFWASIVWFVLVHSSNAVIQLVYNEEFRHELRLSSSSLRAQPPKERLDQRRMALTGDNNFIRL